MMISSLRATTIPRSAVPIALWACAAASVGCSSASPSTTAPLLDGTRTGDAFDGAQCSAIRPPTEPDLMGWDPGSRLNMKSMREQGVVAVRYRAAGCNVDMEILNCTGEGTYEFSAYSAKETKIARSTRDLFADLPIGAAHLEAQVGGGRALRTDYMLAGVYRMPSYGAFPVDKLRGSACAQATHVVAKMYVGGFGMVAGVSESVAASASVFGVEAGGSQDRSTQRISAEGNPLACERSQADGKPDPLCSVPLRVGLVPIEGRAADCPAGTSFAAGQGCVAPAARLAVEWSGSPRARSGWARRAAIRMKRRFIACGSARSIST